MAPSQRLENRILAIPGGAGAPERRRGGSRRLVAAAACALLLVVAGAGVLATRDGSGHPSQFEATRVVQLASTHPDGVSARIEIGRADGARIPMRIVATGLPSGGDHYYGLWLTGADGAVSGGSFRPDGKGECAVMMEVPSGEWTAVDVTEGDRPPSPRTTMAGAPL